MFKKLKEWLETKIREIKDRLTKWLGGYTKKDVEKMLGCEKLRNTALQKDIKRARECADYFEKLYYKTNGQLDMCKSKIPIDPKYGYTRDNIIEASKAQTMFNLGKAVYQHAYHTITAEGVYSCSVQVIKKCKTA